MFVDGVKIEQVGRVRVERLGHHLDVAIDPPGLSDGLPGVIFAAVVIAAAIGVYAQASSPNIAGTAFVAALIIGALLGARVRLIEALMRVSLVADGTTFTLRRESRLEKTAWSGDVTRLQLEGPVDRFYGVPDEAAQYRQVPRLILKCDGAELELGFGLSWEELQLVARHWKLARSGTMPR